MQQNRGTGENILGKTIKQELTFTGMMVSVMVVIMLLYNSIFTLGWTGDALRAFAIQLIPTLIVAFVIETLIVSHNAHKLHAILVSPHDPKLKHILVMTLLIVTSMAALMSLYGTLVSTGTEDAFWYHYFMNFLRNWPFALFVQLTFAGPVVRWLHMRIFTYPKPTQ